MSSTIRIWNRGWVWLALLGALTLLIYWPGLYGAYVFDDMPNIVNNSELQISGLRTAELTRAALSSPSSEFKRPLASLSFALNHVATGLDPFPMKLTNLVIHLLNGTLLFLLGKALLARAWASQADGADRAARIAALIAGAWMLLPINLTAVLYVVQRMESLAQLFVLLGLLGYLHGRRRMTTAPTAGLIECALWLLGMTGLGVAAKESAIVLPLYTLLMEWLLLGGLRPQAPERRRIALLYSLVLLLPMIIGLWWLLPQILSDNAWVRREFNLTERLMTEGRIVLSYIAWTLLPLPQWLSFYHDHIEISRGWLTPWTTLVSHGLLLTLAVGAFAARRKAPLFALGVAWFFAAHVLTATILPLELAFEHRNYFASFGVLLAIFPLLMPLRSADAAAASTPPAESAELARVGPVIVGVLIVLWAGFSAMSARIWSDPLRLSLEFEGRAPDSIRARYETGVTYLKLSRYDPASPFVDLALKAFENAIDDRLDANILPEQALIYVASRVGRSIEPRWWESMHAKLRSRPPSSQDDGALMALTRCARDKQCNLPVERMVDTYLTALSHPQPSARLLAAYGDYAWNVLGDHDLAETLARDSVRAQPSVAAYRITLIKMLLARGKRADAESEIDHLSGLPGWSRPETLAEALTGNSATLKSPDGIAPGNITSAAMPGSQ